MTEKSWMMRSRYRYRYRYRKKRQMSVNIVLVSHHFEKHGLGRPTFTKKAVKVSLGLAVSVLVLLQSEI